MSAGKGDTPRPVNAEVYGKNYNSIFRKTKWQTTQKTTDSESLQDDQDSSLGNNELPHHFD
jgi:hypothetical protein